MLVTGPATTVPIPTRRFARDCRLLFQANNALAPWNTIARRNNLTKDGIRASAGELLGPVKPAKPQLYHPLEDISDSEESDENGDAILKPAETSRTIIETNSKALLMFSGLVSDGVYENVFLPDLPYVKGEHGNIYFQVKSDEDILEDLASGDNLVQVIIGLDTTEMVNEMESSLGQSDDDDDDFEDEDSDFEDDESENYGNDWVSVLEDDGDSDGAHSLGDWAKLETMRLSHPMDFAKHLADFVSDVPINYMEEPPSGISIHGLLRPAFVDENSKEELQKDENFGNGTSYYKLEMIKLQLISAHGNQAYVEVEDFSRCEPDAVAHSAGKIISRLKSGGDKMTRAFKSLCWRCKGIQAEEVALIGVDSLGFYLRVCSGRQVQTLRFTFKNRASSEYGVESQLNGLLFPLNVGQHQKKEVKL